MRKFDPPIVEDEQIGYVVKWRAQHLAGSRNLIRQRRIEILSVPPHYTALLLMDKAGMPRDIICVVCRIAPDRLAKLLRLAWAMQFWPPYAARIELLMPRMPRFPKQGEALELPPLTFRVEDKMYWAEVA